MARRPKFDPTWRNPAYTPEAWLRFLQSQRADVLAQVRRQVHTARSNSSAYKMIDRLDAQIAAAMRIES